MPIATDDPTLYGVNDLPSQCPLCGAARKEGYVGGWHGWECGTASHAHHSQKAALNLVQSIPCAVAHWKRRAIKAEYLLSLIPVPHNYKSEP